MRRMLGKRGNRIVCGEYCREVKEDTTLRWMA